MEIFDETNTKTEISKHLQHLTDEFKRYFPNSRDENIYRLTMDPFHVDIDKLPELLQEQALEIKNDSAAKYDFEKMDISQHSRRSIKAVSTLFEYLFMWKGIFSSSSYKNEV